MVLITCIVGFQVVSIRNGGNLFGAPSPSNCTMQMQKRDVESKYMKCAIVVDWIGTAGKATAVVIFLDLLHPKEDGEEGTISISCTF